MGLRQQAGHEKFYFCVGLYELTVGGPDLIAEHRERSAVFGLRLAETRAFFGDLRRPLAAIDGKPQRKTGREEILAVDWIIRAAVFEKQEFLGDKIAIVGNGVIGRAIFIEGLVDFLEYRGQGP